MYTGAGPPTPAGTTVTESLSIPHATTGVRLARHALADGMDAAGVTGVERDDAILVLSELVSNSVKHADALPTGEIAVRWALAPDSLHLEITDGGAPTLPRVGVAALSALGGRGLDIVRTICRRWGVSEGAQGVTVWADVPRPGRRGVVAD